MQKVVLFFLAAVLVAGSMSCKNAGFKKTKGGMWYKIVNGAPDTGSYAVSGTVMKFDVTYRYKDSRKDTLLRTTVGQMPGYQPIDSTRIPPGYYEIFSKVRNGDSVVLKVLTDSIFHGRPMESWAKKGEYITSNFKIRGVFKVMSEAEADAKLETAAAKAIDSVKGLAQQAKDDQLIEAYLAQHHIKAVKGAKGTYVEILDPGTGNAFDSSETVGVYYTGRNLTDGVAFDSNQDTTISKNKDTLRVNMGLAPAQGGMILGFTDGLFLLHKGAKARLYIPSALGYGEHARGDKIKANENLVFDIVVLSAGPTPKRPTMAMRGMPGGPGGKPMDPAMLAKLRAMQQASMNKNAAPAPAAPGH